MADRVNAATDKLLTVFSELESTKITAKDENTNLFRQITNFEYKIARNQRSVNDYQNYLKFFESFIDLIKVQDFYLKK